MARADAIARTRNGGRRQPGHEGPRLDTIMMLKAEDQLDASVTRIADPRPDVAQIPRTLSVDMNLGRAASAASDNHDQSAAELVALTAAGMRRDRSAVVSTGRSKSSTW